jgi:hypothetical protein
VTALYDISPQSIREDLKVDWPLVLNKLATSVRSNEKANRCGFKDCYANHFGSQQKKSVEYKRATA